MNADFGCGTQLPRLRYLLGLGFCFRANSSSQRSASVRDSNRLLNRKSSIFLNKSFSRRNSTCFDDPLGGIGQKYTRSRRYFCYKYIINTLISMIIYGKYQCRS